MKTLTLAVLGSVALGALGSSAIAADMPVKATPAAVVAYNWSGIYLGGHVGGAWSRTNWTVFDGVAFSEAFRQNTSSWIGGAQVGYLHQLGNIVVGIEGSFSGTDLDKTSLGDAV